MSTQRIDIIESQVQESSNEISQRNIVFSKKVSGGLKSSLENQIETPDDLDELIRDQN